MYLIGSSPSGKTAVQTTKLVIVVEYSIKSQSFSPRKVENGYPLFYEAVISPLELIITPTPEFLYVQ